MQTLSFPRDWLKFLYWAFFKPISLDRYIHQIDPTLGANTGLLTLWRRSREHPEFRPLIKLALFYILITPWFLGFFTAALFAWAGFNVNWLGVARGMALDVAFGVAVGVALDVAFGVALGVVGGVGVGVVGGVGVGVALGVVGGVAFGVALVEFVEFGVAFGVAVGVLSSVGVGVAVGVGVSVGVGVAFGVAFGVSFILSCLRLPLYLVQAPAVWLAARRGRVAWRYSPVVWDELIFLPLPGLDTQLSALGKADRAAGLAAIATVAQSFKQGWAARRALAELALYDVQNARTLETISSISGSLAWLPSNAQNEMKSFLTGIEEISATARAAMRSDTLYNRQEQLRHAIEMTKRLREGFAYHPDRRFAQQAGPALHSWAGIFESELKIANQKEQIPNVYVAGSPLAEKSKVFKGRKDIFRALERELATASEQRPALLLFGARRVGKSSVLRQLPVVLGPQVVPVTVDMQNLALTDNAVALFGKIADEVKKSAFVTRHLELPEISTASLQSNPYLAFSEWLKQVENFIENRWILLSLDEYEYLEKMLADGRVDERAFQLLRSLLQNYPRLTVLFSGAHTFEELSPVWSHHLINVRTLKIGHLAEQEARELIEHPIQPFPLNYTGDTVRQLLAVVSGQPYLLQAVCRDLVNLLNEADRLNADEQDIECALDSALTSASAYFQELWSGPDSNDGQRAILAELSKQGGKPVAEERLRQLASVADIRKLVHHDVIEKTDGNYIIKVELVRRWIETQL